MIRPLSLISAAFITLITHAQSAEKNDFLPLIECYDRLWVHQATGAPYTTLHDLGQKQNWGVIIAAQSLKKAGYYLLLANAVFFYPDSESHKLRLEVPDRPKPIFFTYDRKANFASAALQLITSEPKDPNSYTTLRPIPSDDRTFIDRDLIKRIAMTSDQFRVQKSRYSEEVAAYFADTLRYKKHKFLELVNDLANSPQKEFKELTENWELLEADPRSMVAQEPTLAKHSDHISFWFKARSWLPPRPLQDWYLEPLAACKKIENLEIKKAVTEQEIRIRSIPDPNPVN